MQKRPLIAAGTALTLTILLACGCHTNKGATEAGNKTVPVPRQTPSPSAPTASTGPSEPQPAAPKPLPSRDTTAIMDEVNKVVADPNGPFPKGTRLAGVRLKDGVATLDFNKAFNKLRDSGESTEAEAQRTLRRTLAHYFNVEKMRVTVQGKPFESQATDWNTPFPVRMNGDFGSLGARP